MRNIYYILYVIGDEVGWSCCKINSLKDKKQQDRAAEHLLDWIQELVFLVINMNLICKPFKLLVFSC